MRTASMPTDIETFEQQKLSSLMCSLHVPTSCRWQRRVVQSRRCAHSCIRRAIRQLLRVAGGLWSGSFRRLSMRTRGQTGQSRQLFLERIGLGSLLLVLRESSQTIENSLQLQVRHGGPVRPAERTETDSCTFYLHDDEWLFGGREVRREPFEYSIAILYNEPVDKGPDLPRTAGSRDDLEDYESCVRTWNEDSSFKCELHRLSPPKTARRPRHDQRKYSRIRLILRPFAGKLAILGAEYSLKRPASVGHGLPRTSAKERPSGDLIDDRGGKSRGWLSSPLLELDGNER